MQKLFFFLVLFISICLGNIYPEGLLDIYQRGVIKIEPDPCFGKDTGWESLLYDVYKDVLVAPDGNIFVSNNRLHNFYKLSPEGKLQGTFGREGRGPGDFYYPGLKTCLDGKYLVFSEYAEIRKISVFDFSGKCVTTFRTEMNCSGTTGLKNGYIAYYSSKSEPETKKGKSSSAITVHIVNMNSKNKSEFPCGEVSTATIKVIGNSVMGPAQSYLGDFIFQRTGDGNLLTGNTNSPDITIFSPEGKVLKTFRLNIKPIPVTDKIIEKERAEFINKSLNQVMDKELKKYMRKALEKSDFANLFGEYLPYYVTIEVDSDGNILVFKWPEPGNKTNGIIFQVYSPEGKYICETALDTGNFYIPVWCNFQTMQFTREAFYGIVTDAEDEDKIRLVKVKF